MPVSFPMSRASDYEVLAASMGRSNSSHWDGQPGQEFVPISFQPLLTRHQWDDRVVDKLNSGHAYVGVTAAGVYFCLLYTSPSPRDKRQSRMPSSA